MWHREGYTGGGRYFSVFRCSSRSMISGSGSNSMARTRPTTSYSRAVDCMSSVWNTKLNASMCMASQSSSTTLSALLLLRCRNEACRALGTPRATALSWVYST